MRAIGGHQVSHAVELREQIALGRAGEPFLVARDGDDRQRAVRIGATTLTFRAPAGSGARTGLAVDAIPAPDLTPMQRRVLIALCRPLAEGAQPRLPATNRTIADELVLSVEAVKTHIRALFSKFAVEDLPQNRKRARLAERAHQAGIW